MVPARRRVNPSKITTALLVGAGTALALGVFFYIREARARAKEKSPRQQREEVEAALKAAGYVDQAGNADWGTFNSDYNRVARLKPGADPEWLDAFYPSKTEKALKQVEKWIGQPLAGEQAIAKWQAMVLAAPPIPVP